MNDLELRNKIREAVRTALLESAAVPAEPSAPSAYFAPWTGVSYEAHPSQQKFNIAEASSLLANQTTQLDNLLEFTSAQGCTIEKGKPCDQCGMCRSLGF